MKFWQYGFGANRRLRADNARLVEQMERYRMQINMLQHRLSSGERPRYYSEESDFARLLSTDEMKQYQYSITREKQRIDLGNKVKK